MTTLGERVNILERDFNNHKAEFDTHKVEFNARGKNHDRASQTMSDFASGMNKLLDKVAYLEKKEMVHDIVITDFREFIKDVSIKMSSIEKSIVSTNSKDNTRIEMLKFIAQLLSPIIGVIGAVFIILKYSGLY